MLANIKLIGNLSNASNRFSTQRWTTAMNQVKRAVIDEAGIIQRMLYRTTATWKHNVTFNVEVKALGNSYEVWVFTDDEIYFYLNYGTTVRYATMTRDFKPKTHYRVLGSGAGAGRKDYVNSKAPRAGIEGRQWVDEIYIRRAPLFRRKIERIIKYATR